MSPPAPCMSAPFLVSLPKATTTTGSPIPAIRGHVESKVLSPITTPASVNYHYPTTVPPVITTLPIMELMGFGAQQLRNSMAHVITAARTKMARQRQRQRRYISDLQAPLAEKGPYTRKLEDLIGEPAHTRT